MKKKLIISAFCLLQLLLSCGKKRDSTFEIVDSTPGYTETLAPLEQDPYRETIKKGWKEVNAYYTYHFTGKINNTYAFDMNLRIIDDRISGYYYYLKYEKPIQIEGEITGNVVFFTEELGNTFEGIFDHNKGEISGYWTNKSTGETFNLNMANPKGKGYPKRSYRVLATEKSPGSDTYYISQIEETDSKNQKRIIPIESQFWETEIVDKFDLYIEDYNFDGYLDLCSFQSLPSKYVYFTYDAANRNYVENAQYSHFDTPPFATNFRKKLLYFRTDFNNKYYSIYQYYQGWLRKIYVAASHVDESDDWAEYYHYVNEEALAITPAAFEAQYGKQVLQVFETAEEQ